MVKAPDRRQQINDFSGGLINGVDESSLSENQLAELINLEVEAQGTLVSRPPISVQSDSYLSSGQGSWDVIGDYIDPNTGVLYLIVNNAQMTYFYRPDTNGFIPCNGLFADAVQYDGKLYVVSTAAAGGYFAPSAGVPNTYVYTSLSGANPMPRGTQIIAFKERLWIVGLNQSIPPFINNDFRTRVYVSNITSTVPTSINEWPPLNYFDVGSGDGQYITKLYPSTTDLFILRNQSSYYFHYETDVSLFTLTRIEGNIGSDSQRTTAVYNNNLYTFCNGILYKMISYQFYPLNTFTSVTIDRKYVTGAPPTNTVNITEALSVLGTRIIVWYYGSTYVYNIVSSTWSQWESTTNLALLRLIPKQADTTGPDVGIGVTGFRPPLNSTTHLSYQPLLRMEDTFNTGHAEAMTCSFRTRAYDYDASDSKKVLFWWSLDAAVTGDVTGTATPVVIDRTDVTYDDLAMLTIDQLTGRSIDDMLASTSNAITTWSVPVGAPYRTSIKFRRKLRFRRVGYGASMTNDGTTATAPTRIFSIVTYVENRSRNSEAVT